MVSAGKKINKNYQEVVDMSTTLTSEEFQKQLMRKPKSELAKMLADYTYVCNNDKSTGTSLESAIAKIMGATVDLQKKHGYDSIYENGNTLEIKPENVYYPTEKRGLYYPVNSKRLNMLGKYNDFTWHAIIRYINGKETNSNQGEVYFKELEEFIDTYYDDEEYKIFMKVACSFYNKDKVKYKKDKEWLQLLIRFMPANFKNAKHLKDVQPYWDSIVKKVRRLKGTVKPTMWNKYHVAGGAVGGTIIYVARIDFPIVYERLFERMLDDYPPEMRFTPVKSRCQIDFTCACLNETNKDGVMWKFIAEDIEKYKPCISNTLWNIIEETMI